MALNVDLLEAGFDEIADHGADVVDLFYARLLAMDRKLARRFIHISKDPAAMAKQKAKLVGVLLLVRRSLRNLESILPDLAELGALHTRVHVQPHEYMAVVFALIESMGEVGGHGWIESYGLAWTRACLLLVAAMLQDPEAEAQAREEDSRALRDVNVMLRFKLLKETVRPYLAHTRECATRRWIVRRPCNCGYEVAKVELLRDGQQNGDSTARLSSLR